ncbi:hypothetical protein [Butyrivibrio fibrisolvens]|nr:hypothetical protein [Butyrivibrio fibrisolvens]
MASETVTYFVGTVGRYVFYSLANGVVAYGTTYTGKMLLTDL